MNYEKLYKNALKKIREGLQPLSDGTKISGVTRAFLEEVFPELQESEDEKKKNVKRLAESFDIIKDNLLEDICKWIKENYHEYDGRDEFRMDLMLLDLKQYFKYERL